jgi:hypothetical protein
MSASAAASAPAPMAPGAPVAFAPLVAAPDASAPDASAPARVLIVGCGALARELVDLVRRNNFTGIDITCLPAALHMRPEKIPAAVVQQIRAKRAGYDQVFVAYGDCGTGGRLDKVLAEEGVERLPGAHCYEFYAGRTDFAALADEELGSFYLTDYLARHFERLVIMGLGIDRHPELLPIYFGNYRRVVYLSQGDDPETMTAARAAATRLGLEFVHHPTGFGGLGTAVVALGELGTPVAALGGPATAVAALGAAAALGGTAVAPLGTPGATAAAALAGTA